MSGGHSTSRRRSYGRRRKELQARPQSELKPDLEGPGGWRRGPSWDLTPRRSADRPLAGGSSAAPHGVAG
jgi:hypothetical protein